MILKDIEGTKCS